MVTMPKPGISPATVLLTCLHLAAGLAAGELIHRREQMLRLKMHFSGIGALFIETVYHPDKQVPRLGGW
jgi:hypothetical protein